MELIDFLCIFLCVAVAERVVVMMLRQVLLVLLALEEVKGNQEDNEVEAVVVPPPSFVAVVPTSIMGEFQGAGLFPFVVEEETTTSTTTTTPAPFGKQISVPDKAISRVDSFHV